MVMKRVFLMTVLGLSLMVLSAAALVVPTFSGSTAAVSAITTTQIIEYQVIYSANTFPPRIWLKAGGTGIGQLIFRPDGSTLPPDSNVSGQLNLYYHLEDFQNCIDLLRNENPVYLVWAGAGAGNENGIRTNAEPVGEGENAPSLIVTVPNGGEKLLTGARYNITWKSYGSPGPFVKIELMNNGTLNRVISSSTDNNGSFRWTIPSTQGVGPYFKIKITSTSITAITDSSDSVFSINPV